MNHSPLPPRGIKYEKNLWERRDGRNNGVNGGFEEWRVNTVFYTGLDSKPHLACPLIEGIIPDDRIRRAELLSILRLMISAMRHASVLNAINWHMIYPVSPTYRIRNRLLTTNR
jgi:hypothetical protein